MKIWMSGRPYLLFVFFLLTAPWLYSRGFEGYYLFPDIHGDRIVFTAEGDPWTVPVSGGVASRPYHAANS